jgi:hypothetical protein
VRDGGKLKDDLDELFQLPLTEFIAARNALATRLKQSGRADDATFVKTLTKPSISAWTVNQLYWNHRTAFDRLLAAGQRFHRAQTSGKLADMRGSLAARGEALSQLSDLATSLLQDAGHNPSPDTIRRITTTLEAISASTDGLTVGHLTHDIDPPGFESLAAFVPDAGVKKRTAEPAQKTKTLREVPRPEETRHAKIAAAKVSLQAARKSLADARARAQTFETAQKKAYAEVKQVEKELREAEERLKKATAASEEATKAVEDAERIFENASKELESLFSKH